MSEYLTLLDAIHANPDEDSVRLGLADWLLEHGDESQRARGELIQLQIAIDRLPDGRGTVCDCSRGESNPECRFGEFSNLTEKERVLLNEYANSWRRGPDCHKCKGNKGYKSNSGATWFPCKHCKGTGDSGGLMHSVPVTEGYSSKAKSWTHKHKVEYFRGMKRVHAIMDDCFQEVSDHDNDCRCIVPSNWLVSVLRHHPDVVEVWTSDPSAYLMVHLPESVWRTAFPGIPPNSEEERRLAISRAIVRWARTFLNSSQESKVHE